MTATALPTAGTAPSLAAGVAGRLRDVAVLTMRNVVHLRREPLRLSDVTIQPVLFTLLFVYVFGAGVTLPGGGSYTQYAIAGLLAMNITTAAIGTSVGITSDLGSGVIDRFRTLAMWPAAVLVARSLADFLGSVVLVAIVAGVGLIVGWQPHAGALDTLAGFGVFLLFGYALSWLCGCVGIASDDAESAQSLGLIVLFPLAFVSNALVATQHMPAALRAVADYNPVSAVTAAGRQLFGNPNPSAAIHAWPMQHPVLAALTWSIGLLVVCAPLAAWLYRRKTSE